MLAFSKPSCSTSCCYCNVHNFFVTSSINCFFGPTELLVAYGTIVNSCLFTCCSTSCWSSLYYRRCTLFMSSCLVNLFVFGIGARGVLTIPMSRITIFFASSCFRWFIFHAMFFTNANLRSKVLALQDRNTTHRAIICYPRRSFNSGCPVVFGHSFCSTQITSFRVSICVI